MVQRRMTNREATGPDHRPLIGRGYELLDDEGTVLRGPSLRPGSSSGVAVVTVHPTDPAEREALKQRWFGVDRPVQLRVSEGAVGLFDAEGRVRAGEIAAGRAEATAELLRGEPELAAWICWEWLSDDGRSSVDVALTKPDEMPRQLEPTGVSTAGVEEGSPGNRRMWVGLIAALVIIAVVFVACT